jgi:hypothetical protein
MSGAAMRRWRQRPSAPLLVIAAVKFAIHLATNGVYGFQRDELYCIISGQHPMLGYVDYPPVTPMLAWVNTSIFGISHGRFDCFPAWRARWWCSSPACAHARWERAVASRSWRRIAGL